MSKILILEVEKLEREISATGARIESLKLHIRNQEKDVALAKSVEKGLDQNLAMLKDGSVIASASEYKKIKADLAAMVKKVDATQIDIKNSYVYLERAQKLLIDLKDKHAILTESQMGKVLTGHFGKQE